jgi:hypothetical protein
MCPTCQRLRGTEVARATEAAIVGMDCVRFITLTQAHKDRPLFLSIAAIAASFRALRAKDAWKRHVKGGVYAMEIVFSRQTRMWHVHLHILADGVFWSQKELSDLWGEVTGDSYICDIRLVGSRRAAAAYIAKYVAKPMDVHEWPDEKVCEYADALHGKRMVHTFGKSYAMYQED